jgi:catechol 2,3-dioxygenase-like lactoylglutathione lyase family enzyme
MKSIARLLLLVAALGIFHSASFAQNHCQNAPDYFEPITSGDGQRYPLAIGPVVWRLVGSGVYPVKGSDGLFHVAFAAQFTNAWSLTTTIQSVEVVDPSRNNKLTGTNRVISLKDEDVTGQLKILSLPSTLDKTNYSSKLMGGQSGVMFFDVTFRDSSDVPCTIALRVHSIHPENRNLPESTVTSPPWKVSTQPAIVLARPFKGDGWVNANGCCLEIGPHRFVTNAMNGTLDPSEQFAIDWIKIDRQGKAFRGDGKKSEQWLCYGVELLAVAPGTVVEVMRDLPDEPPGIAPTNLTIPQIAGNHVILDLGSGRYAMYAHLAPHSATVHVGDRVKAGDKLGLLGNSGNTTGPHLHFQISDRPSTLDTTSLPFVFESMTLESRTPLDLDDIENYSIKGTALPTDTKFAKKLTRAMPLSRDVIDFPGMPDFYNKVSQVTWVVKNVDATVGAWKEFGLRDVHDLGTVAVKERYRGSEQTVSIHAVTGHLGNLAIVMIEPVTGTDAYTDFLRRHGDGIFSIVHQVENPEMLKAEIDRLGQAGVRVLQQVTMPSDAGSVSYTYFDTEPRGKYVLGLVETASPLPAPESPGVVSHLATAIREAPEVSNFWASLGLPALAMAHATPRDDSTYRGKPLLLTFDVGWQRHTQFTYEWIIPPTDPPNIYADFLKRHGEGIQHIGMPVADLNAAIARYQKLGYSVWQSGAWGDIGKPHSGQYAYMDTDAKGGVVVELIHAY